MFGIWFALQTYCRHGDPAMPAAPAISEKIVAALPVPAKGNKLHYFSGASLQGKKAPAGFAVRVTAAGTKAFVLFHRVNGKPYLPTLGRWDANAGGGSLTVRDAIVAADKLAKNIKNGKTEDPRPERTRRLEGGDRVDGETVSGLLDKFVQRYARKEANLRTADQIEATFDRLVKPRIGKIGIYELRRSSVVEMLDEIDDENGAVMADRVLALVRKAFNWHATRDDDFTPPIVKGMARTKPKERAARRVLADDEIRDLWAALETVDAPDCYATFVKTLLLTATRRNEAADMHTSEIEGDVWTIPGDRYKTKLDHVVPLTPAARALIGGKPPQASKSWFVFSTSVSGPVGAMKRDGAVAFSGFSKAKAELDKTIAAIREREGREPIAGWTLHDLRRTARSLMSRAKVPTDHAERALGHVMGGVRETYDRYEYLDEKRAAFEALAALVERILQPVAGNVEDFAARRAVQS
jgi:integrase